MSIPGITNALVAPAQAPVQNKSKAPLARVEIQASAPPKAPEPIKSAAQIAQEESQSGKGIEVNTQG